MELLERKQTLKIWKNLSLSTLKGMRKPIQERTQGVWPNDHLTKTMGLYQLHLM